LSEACACDEEGGGGREEIAHRCHLAKLEGQGMEKLNASNVRRAALTARDAVFLAAGVES